MGGYHQGHLTWSRCTESKDVAQAMLFLKPTKYGTLFFILLGDLIMDYMLVARSKSADGFSTEPGAVYFLGIPSD